MLNSLQISQTIEDTNLSKSKSSIIIDQSQTHIKEQHSIDNIEETIDSEDDYFSNNTNNNSLKEHEIITAKEAAKQRIKLDRLLQVKQQALEFKQKILFQITQNQKVGYTKQKKQRNYMLDDILHNLDFKNESNSLHNSFVYGSKIPFEIDIFPHKQLATLNEIAKKQKLHREQELQQQKIINNLHPPIHTTKPQVPTPQNNNNNFIKNGQFMNRSRNNSINQKIQHQVNPNQNKNLKTPQISNTNQQSQQKVDYLTQNQLQKQQKQQKQNQREKLKFKKQKKEFLEHHFARRKSCTCTRCGGEQTQFQKQGFSLKFEIKGKPGLFKTKNALKKICFINKIKPAESTPSNNNNNAQIQKQKSSDKKHNEKEKQKQLEKKQNEKTQNNGNNLFTIKTQQKNESQPTTINKQQNENQPVINRKTERKQSLVGQFLKLPSGNLQNQVKNNSENNNTNNQQKSIFGGIKRKESDHQNKSQQEDNSISNIAVIKERQSFNLKPEQNLQDQPQYQRKSFNLILSPDPKEKELEKENQKKQNEPKQSMFGGGGLLNIIENAIEHSNTKKHKKNSHHQHQGQDKKNSITNINHHRQLEDKKRQKMYQNKTQIIVKDIKRNTFLANHIISDHKPRLSTNQSIIQKDISQFQDYREKQNSLGQNEFSLQETEKHPKSVRLNVDDQIIVQDQSVQNSNYNFKTEYKIQTNQQLKEKFINQQQQLQQLKHKIQQQKQEAGYQKQQKPHNLNPLKLKNNIQITISSQQNSRAKLDSIHSSTSQNSSQMQKKSQQYQQQYQSQQQQQYQLNQNNNNQNKRKNQKIIKQNAKSSNNLDTKNTDQSYYNNAGINNEQGPIISRTSNNFYKKNLIQDSNEKQILPAKYSKNNNFSKSQQIQTKPYKLKTANISPSKYRTEESQFQNSISKQQQLPQTSRNYNNSMVQTSPSNKKIKSSQTNRKHKQFNVYQEYFKPTSPNNQKNILINPFGTNNQFQTQSTTPVQTAHNIQSQISSRSQARQNQILSPRQLVSSNNQRTNICIPLLQFKETVERKNNKKSAKSNRSKCQKLLLTTQRQTHSNYSSVQFDNQLEYNSIMERQEKKESFKKNTPRRLVTKRMKSEDAQNLIQAEQLYL